MFPPPSTKRAGTPSNGRAKPTAEAAREQAEARPVADPKTVENNVFSTHGALQAMGGQWTHGYLPPTTTEEARPEGQRINMVTAIRRTLDAEMALNDRVRPVW